MHRLLQRKCACGGTPGPTGECAECRKKRLGLQRKESALVPAVAPPIVHEVLRRPGRPLEPETRGFMENRFGHDFSQVRVHADAEAAESARSVGALAYTVGSHVAFDQGRYAPGSGEGKELLAHELAHVVQQGASAAAPASGGLPISPAGDALEAQADSAAAAALQGQSPGHGSTSRLSLQRAPAQTRGCNDENKAALLEAHRWGFEMVRQAAFAMTERPSGQELSEPVRIMAQRWFKLDWPAEDPGMLGLWNHVFLAIGSLVEQADATKYRCGSVFDKLAIAWPGGRIAVYPPFWTLDPDQRAATLVHEWGHRWGRGMRRIFESYCGHDKFAAFPPEKLVQMPDAYMGFIYELAEGRELPATGLCEYGSPAAPGPESFPAHLFPAEGTEGDSP